MLGSTTVPRHVRRERLNRSSMASYVSRSRGTLASWTSWFSVSSRAGVRSNLWTEQPRLSPSSNSGAKRLHNPLA